MSRFVAFKQRAIGGLVMAGLVAGGVSLGLAGAAQAGDMFRPGHQGGGFSHGGAFGGHAGSTGQRAGAYGMHAGAYGGFANRPQRFGGVNPGAPRFGSAVRPGRYVYSGVRHPGWRYGGVATGLALGTGLAYGASAYPYGYGYGYDEGYDDGAPGYAYGSGDADVPGTDYGDAGYPYADGGDGGAWDDNGTHYTCSPYEKKTRLQKRACGNG